MKWIEKWLWNVVKRSDRAKNSWRTQRRIVIGLSLMVILGCAGLGGNFVETEQGLTSLLTTETQLLRGQEGTVLLQVNGLQGENNFASVITPDPHPGVTFSPASRTVTISDMTFTGETEFSITALPNAEFGVSELTFRRTGEQPEANRTAKVPIRIISAGVAATISPQPLDLIAGGASAPIEIALLPVGDTNGEVLIRTSSDNFYLTETPADFRVQLVRGSTTPVRRTVQVRALGEATPGQTTFRVIYNDYTIATSTVNVTAGGGGDPGITLTANPTQVVSPNGELSAQVQFTVRSTGGYSGPVTLDWTESGGVSPQPNDNDFQVNVTPTTPATFTRRFLRHATHPAPTSVTFTATGTGEVPTQTVTVDVLHPDPGRPMLRKR